MQPLCILQVASDAVFEAVCPKAQICSGRGTSEAQSRRGVCTSTQLESVGIPFRPESGMIEGSLEVKLPTIKIGKAEVGRVKEEKKRSDKIREERRCRRAKR